MRESGSRGGTEALWNDVMVRIKSAKAHSIV